MGDDIKVINGIVTGVCIGTPMQDATPVNADDNKPYFVERNIESSAKNYEDALEVENKNPVLSINGVVPDKNGNVEVTTQSDWSQNDSTAPDYIKNRICYSEQSTSELIVGSFTPSSTQTPAGAVSFSTPFYKWGNEIVCNVDGIDIICTYSDEGEYTYYRNTDHGLIFKKHVVEDLPTITVPSTMVGKEITIKAVTTSTIYHKIPDEYINKDTLTLGVQNQITSLDSDVTALMNLIETPQPYTAHSTIYLKDTETGTVTSLSIKNGSLFIGGTQATT